MNGCAGWLQRILVATGHFLSLWGGYRSCASPIEGAGTIEQMGEGHQGNQAWTDEYTLLCERCGYVVDGLAEDGVCPECGLEIARSLPSNRPGTPWQQRSGFRSMLETSMTTLRHPVRTLDTLAVTPPRLRPLVWLAAIPFGQLMGVALLLLFEIERPLPNGGSMSWTPGSAPGSVALGVILGVLFTPIAAAVLTGLTWIEARGLVIFSAQRGGRVYPELAHCIVRHGAAGWLVSGLGAIMMLPLMWSFELELGLYLGHQQDGSPQAWVFALAVAGVGVTILGFLGFEFFAWLGLRRCKFANRPKPDDAFPQTRT